LIAQAGETATDAAPAFPNPKTCADAPAGMSCVPGGEGLRGWDNDTFYKECKQIGSPRMKGPDTTPQATVYVETFYMDTHEVTNEAYNRCMKAGKCNKARPLYQDYGAAKQPMTGVSWYDAVKYCEVQGKHLPTEAEWERAARGPKGELYPWGNEPEASCERAVIMNRKGERSCGAKKRRGKSPEKGRVLEVGSKPAGRYGLYDMVGNAEEWVYDWYSKSYENCGEACLGVNPKGPCNGEEPCKGYRYRGVRGGSWYYPAACGTGIHRRPHVPSNKPYHHFGFRCAASVEEAAALGKGAAAAP